MLRALLLLGLLAGLDTRVAAQEVDPSQGSATQADAPEPTPICTDRPTRANGPCTVPQGHVQLETDLIDWTRQDLSGVRTDTILFTNPTLKYGIAAHADVEINIAPYTTVRTRMADGSVATDRGIGDLYLRFKRKLTADGSKTEVALIASVKAPTAGSTLGNGRWEGSLGAPVNIPLPAKFTLTTNPELDVAADHEGDGYHLEVVNLVALAHPVGKDATVYAELWTKDSFEPMQHMQQYSADLAASYLLTPTVQLDAAAYMGLNRETPGLQVYAGLSVRF